MSTSRVLASLGLVSALALGGCVLDTSESDDPAEAVQSVDNSLEGISNAGDDRDEAGFLIDTVEFEREADDTDTLMDKLDHLGHEEEPDPVPWEPDLSGQDGSGTNKDKS